MKWFSRKKLLNKTYGEKMKIGYIEITGDFINDDLYKNFQALGFVELETDKTYLTDRWKVYKKLFAHNLFDDVEEGQLIPLYLPTLRRNDIL